MKLLLDNNLSPRIAAALQRAYPGTAHVREFELQRAPDTRIWEFAKSQGFVIASKDADFHQRSFLYGPPPKVVWIRLGNCAVDETLSVLLDSLIELERFVADEKAAFMAIPSTNVAHRA